MTHTRSTTAMLLALAATLTLVGCGGVKIAPTVTLPKALVGKVPTRVGVVVAGDMRNYTHSETRGGVPWTFELGAGHRKFSLELVALAFAETEEFADLDAARAATGLKAIFEPRIEQYSFATARETGGEYVAVTIRYRINLFAPDGNRVDSFTLTGYGNSVAGGMSSGDPLDLASRRAMRDAAAKFLTQFPEQPVALQLAKGEALIASATPDAALLASNQIIEAVPIFPSRRARAARPSLP